MMLLYINLVKTFLGFGIMYVIFLIAVTTVLWKDLFLLWNGCTPNGEKSFKTMNSNLFFIFFNLIDCNIYLYILKRYLQ